MSMLQPFALVPIAPRPGYEHRYWRILVTANNGHPNYLAICEMEYRATLGGADLTNPAEAAAGAASVSDVEAASGWAVSGRWVFDDSDVYTGVASVQWLSGNNGIYPKWAMYDFGHPTSGAKVRVAQVLLKASHTTDSNPSTTAPKDFEIQGSDDGVTWFTYYIARNETGWAPAESRLYNL